MCKSIYWKVVPEGATLELPEGKAPPPHIRPHNRREHAPGDMLESIKVGTKGLKHARVRPFASLLEV